MAAKSAPTDRSPPQSTFSPLQITPSDKLLASRIPLPAQPCISYALFRPTANTLSAHDSIEHARRSVISLNASANLLDSMLTSVYIGPAPFIYIFKVTQEELVDSAGEMLDSLVFDGLAIAERSSFSPQSVSSLLPNSDERDVYSHFYEAVRVRTIDDIVTASSKPHGSATRRHAKRFKNGFVMSHALSAADWEYKAITRPLIFCQLQVHFSYSSEGIPTHLAIHPIILPTPFLDLPRSLPLPAGTPITLLPYGTPAYFLASYTGPTAGLTKQFRASLQGMGAGAWEIPAKHTSEYPFTYGMDVSSADNQHQNATFIIGWIKVENKQGEDKGITIIYPARLCLSYLPFPSPRAPLDFVPELPAPLQPSPQPAPAFPAVSATLSALSDSGRPASTSILSHPNRPTLVSRPTSESLHSFRALTLSKTKDFRQVVTEVGGYVDAVARERERERERIKREREGGPSSSPKLARTTATTPASAPTPMSVDTATPAPIAITTTQPTPIHIPLQSHQPPVQQLQTSALSQNFYPSPPHTVATVVPPVEAKTSPVIETAPPFPTADTATSVASSAPAATPVASGSSNGYDPFGNMDTTWGPQTSEGYLGMDIDMDFGMGDMGMSFDVNMGSSASNSGGRRGAYNDHRGGMEFEDAFTDDDFSFFDRPSRSAPSAAPSSSHFPAVHSRVTSGSGSHPLATSSTMGTSMSPSLFGDVHSSGPGHLNHSHSSSSHNQQMWTPGGFGDGFTPHSAIDHNDSIPPDLLPSSPGQTPETHSAPATPNIHLDLDAAHRRPSTSSSHTPNLFEPIPFAPYHRAADGKYAFGKFALPSPPAEDDLADSTFISLPASPSGSSGGWRFRYNAITDPRINVVRKLIGVKRKTPYRQGMRDPPKSSPWIRAHEEWEKPSSEARDDPDAKSEVESDEEDDIDDIESPLMSRPTTPPPAYLPLGPTLLHTQFQHSQLLPLSTPLRPPGAAVAPINLIATNPPPSVPTPVSPAATMGMASEKSKSLEAAAFAVAAEVVENPIWAETWRANTVGVKPVTAVWSSDIKAVAQLLEAVPSLEAPVDMASLFGLDASGGFKPLQALEAPMISIGKGDAIIQVVPTALRFWEKLGLGPRGGCKDLSAFVLFEDDGEQRQPQMESWLASVAHTYQGKHYGTMSPGKSSVCQRDGLLGLRLDTSFRKSLASFIASLSAAQTTVIVFVVLPVTVMTLSSPVLRQVLSASKKVLDGHKESQIVFEFIPEQHIFGSCEKSSAYDSSLDLLASSVYNRILVPVDRVMSRRIHDYTEPVQVQNFFMDPSFTLSRSLYNKVSYVRAAHTSLDVMDRYTLLHVAYHLTACGKWVIAACVDQRGEAYDLGVWLTQSPGEHDNEDFTKEENAIRKVWEFAMQFAKKANVEWRVVFARLGAMPEREMSAWTTQLTVHVLASREQPPLHHSVVCVEPNASWSFIPSKPSPTTPQTRPSLSNKSSSSSSKHHSVFTDVSATSYAIFPSTHMSVSLAPVHTDLGLSQSFIPEPPSTSSPSSPQPYSAITSPIAGIASSLSATYLKASVLPPGLIITDDDPTSFHPHPLTLMPLSTAILIHVPTSSSLTSVKMVHIHLLRSFHSYSYTHSAQALSAPTPDKELLVDVTKNYHDLAVLSKTRWKLDGNSALPFHLAAVDAMRMSLDRDWDRQDGGMEP
ncbi:mediator complex subunit 13 C-terminal-domain-containing protein [Crassisporium funariophilum]|nr:mediator complex subunit 13 C-terminal-domain-containing protein [Crassisporium funariophilum]